VPQVMAKARNLHQIPDPAGNSPPPIFPAHSSFDLLYPFVSRTVFCAASAHRGQGVSRNSPSSWEGRSWILALLRTRRYNVA
jgi:hypothetical protein